LLGLAAASGWQHERRAARQVQIADVASGCAIEQRLDARLEALARKRLAS
jgi:hypothetical protein